MHFVYCTRIKKILNSVSKSTQFIHSLIYTLTINFVYKVDLLEELLELEYQYGTLPGQSYAVQELFTYLEMVSHIFCTCSRKQFKFVFVLTASLLKAAT